MSKTRHLNRRHLLLGSLATVFATPARGQSDRLQGRPEGLDARQFGVRAHAPGEQTQQLQRAIDRAAQANQPLWLAAGTYRSGPLTLRAGSQLNGARGAKIALTRGPSLLTAQDSDAIALNGVSLDGSNIALPRDGGLVAISGARDLHIVGCAIANANGNAIGVFRSSGAITGNTITGSADNALYCLDNNGLDIGGNTIAKSGNGGIRVWQSVKRHDGSVVSGNTIDDTESRGGGNGQNGNGVNVYRASGVIVRNNTIRRAAFSAVRGNAASNFQVIGNDCAGFGETAMYAEFEYENASFIDNIIDDAANGIAVTNFDVGGHGGIVRGNIVRNIGQRVRSTLTEGSGNGFGISIEADVIATGNTIEDCAYAALRLGFGPYMRNVTASGNTIRRSPYGIVVTVVKGAGRATITGNRIEGASRGAIVGVEWHKAVSGDLTQGGAEKFPQLRLSGNRAS
ncbi:MAG: TIGR03808 family TAT-translocated repetitive protein [Pseudolabrys sp.]|nr:TIGR03808 family TAT-translocated repetitive protein [Pseudolabrys sp.]MDP2298637.1 TIGR03808 family TAT-translocated repetitive protein [Pseudolabrys sp.]